MDAVRSLVAADPVLSKNLALLRGITGFGEISAIILMAELPIIAEFTPKALVVFAGLSPSEHSSGSSVRKPGRISRVGSERLRSALYMCALSAKQANKTLTNFVGRMTAAGKPPKVIYARLPAWGNGHKTVCHGRGKYARDEDGDGFCEVHVNTLEMGWTAPGGIDVPKCGS